VKQLIWISSLTAVVVLGLAVVGPPAEAHHNSAPFYDDTKSVEAIGVVTEFRFLNPHSFISIQGENEAGEMVEWEVEMGPAVMMSRSGWTPERIKPGDPIRVVGQPSRAPGTHGICCAQLSRPDGSRLGLVLSETDGVPIQMVAFVPSTSEESAPGGFSQ
jgi:hypothetical protein